MFAQLCHHWQTTSQSCRQLIGFTQNLGCRKSHAGSKIDLGPVFREEDEGHRVLSFSIPCLPAAPMFATCNSDMCLNIFLRMMWSQEPKSSEVKGGHIRSAAHSFGIHIQIDWGKIEELRKWGCSSMFVQDWHDYGKVKASLHSITLIFPLRKDLHSKNYHFIALYIWILLDDT